MRNRQLNFRRVIPIGNPSQFLDLLVHFHNSTFNTPYLEAHGTE